MAQRHKAVDTHAQGVQRGVPGCVEVEIEAFSRPYCAGEGVTMPAKDLTKEENELRKKELLDAPDIRGPELVNAAADAIREAASTRAAITRAKEPGKGDAYAVALIPIEGVNEQDAWDAASEFENNRLAEEKIRSERDEADSATYIYFLKCRTPIHMVGGRPAPPHGVYFTKRPGSVVGDDDWYARYKKDANTVWRGQEILCQVCLMMNIEGARLHYEWQDPHRGLWIPDKRWIWKQPRDLKRLKIEGMTRAFDLPTESSNLWRAENEAKLAKARQEGVLTNG